MTERSIEKQILDLLAALGVEARKNVVEKGRRSFAATGLGAGSADIVGADSKQRGRAVFVEVKAPGEHPSPKQIEFANAMERAGALVVRCATSVEQVRDAVLAARAA